MPHPDHPGAPAAPPPRGGSVLLSTVGWAFYLACSWTWCIGMFLPVLLLRDLGPWGYAVFFIPNVLGAGAMGWVLARPGASGSIVRRHGAACAAFSAVTVAFQAFFFVWIDSGNARSPGSWALRGAFVVPVVLSAFWMRGGGRGVAVAVWCVSAGVGAWLLSSGGAAPGPIPPPAGAGVIGAVWLAPVCLFGFALCPYLDLTFHRACAATASCGASRAAFTLGFGVLFAAMALLTVLYAPVFLNGPAINGLLDPSSLAGVSIATHLGLQLSYTASLHAGEVGLLGPSVSLSTPRAIVSLLGIAALVSAACFVPPHAGLSAGEVVYRLFMSFYGLVFPAYVWLCVIPTADGRSGPSRHKVRVLALAVGLAAPMFWMGFIGRQWAWLGPGLLVVLLARLLVRSRAGRRAVLEG